VRLGLKRIRLASAGLKEVESGLQELRKKDERITEEFRLQKELDQVNLERTRETWLLKNDNKNLEKTISELQEQLKAQKKAHQGNTQAL
jgi:hypothetical protein